MGYAAYVVTKGKRPGIYENWLEASWQIEGIKDPIYKGYNTFEEASTAWRNIQAKGYIRRVPAPDDNSDNTDNEAVPSIPRTARVPRNHARARPSPAHSVRLPPSPAGSHAHAAASHSQTAHHVTNSTRQRHSRDSAEYDSPLNEVRMDFGGASAGGVPRRPEPAPGSLSGDPRFYSSTSPLVNIDGSARASDLSRRAERNDTDTRRREGWRESSSIGIGAFREGSSGPTSDVTNVEDGHSPLVHQRRRAAREVERERTGLGLPNEYVRGAYQHQDGGIRANDQFEPDRRPLRSQLGGASPRHVSDESNRGSRKNTAAARGEEERRSLPRRTFSVAETSGHEWVPTEPNTPTERNASLRNPRTSTPHEAHDACIPGLPDVHKPSCPLFQTWLKSQQDPLQTSFRADRLARTRSEPAPSSWSDSTSDRRRPSLIPPLSPDISMTGLQNAYASGPAGATPPTSPASRPSRIVRDSATNALGLSPGTAHAPSIVFPGSGDPRSPLQRGTPVPLGMSFPQFHRPSPSVDLIDSRLVRGA